MRKPKIAAREPWHPAPYEKPDVAAIKAFARGEANEGQQKRALDWIIRLAAMTYDQSFYPGDAYVTAFLEGRRSVGNQIVKLVNMDMSNLEGGE